MTDLLRMLGSSDLAITLLLSAGSFLAVWIPFWRAMHLCRRARHATRRIESGEAGRRLRAADGRPAPIALRMLQVAEESLREGDESRAFVIDAARQYAEHEYESGYARPISMYANILPPLGFIGTLAGLLILFMSMRVSSASLELGALALALTSTLFALIAFAVLEGLKIRLYGRLAAALDHALSHVPAPARARPRAAAAE
jgi:hypothetical protein